MKNFPSLLTISISI